MQVIALAALGINNGQNSTPFADH